MVEKKEQYAYNESENAVVKTFVAENNGEKIASGFVYATDKELLELYKTDPELAMKDTRMPGLLEPAAEP